MPAGAAVDYAPPPPGRARWLRRAGVAAFVLLLIALLIHLLPPAYRRAEVVLSLRQMIADNPSAGTAVAEPGTRECLLVTDGPFARAAGVTGEIFYVGRHEAPSGRPMLLVLSRPQVPARHPVDDAGRIKANLVRPPTLWRPTELLRGPAELRPPLSADEAPNLVLLAAEPDPDDPSHVIIPYRHDDGRGVIDVYLRDAGATGRPGLVLERRAGPPGE